MRTPKPSAGRRAECCAGRAGSAGLAIDRIQLRAVEAVSEAEATAPKPHRVPTASSIYGASGFRAIASSDRPEVGGRSSSRFNNGMKSLNARS
jgi:hypothetical protein